MSECIGWVVFWFLIFSPVIYQGAKLLRQISEYNKLPNAKRGRDFWRFRG